MKISNAIVLLILVVIVALAVVGVRQGWFLGDSSPDTPAAAERPLLEPPLDVNDVTAIEITPAEGKTVRLTQADGRWQIESPVRGPGRKYRAETIVRNLNDLRVVKQFAPGAADRPDASQTMLGEPEGTIRLVAGKTSHALKVGAPRPLSDQTYVQLAGDDTIYLVRGRPAQSLDVSLEDLREVNVVSFPVDKADYVQMTGLATYTLERRDDGWAVTAPVKAEAETQKVEGFLRNFTNMQATGFVTEGLEDLSAFGLDKPVLQAVIRYTPLPSPAATVPATAPAAEEIRVAFGRRAGRTFGRIDEEPWLFRVEDSGLETLAAKLDNLRDRRVLPIERGRVRAIEIVSAAPTVRITLGGGPYMLTAPQAGQADRAAVNALVDALKALQAQSFVDEGQYASLAGFGLENPATTYALALADGQSCTLQIGGQSETGAMRFVKLAGDDRPTVMTVTAEAIAELPTAVEAFWTKQLLATPAETIADITVTGPDTRYRVEQPLPGEFLLTQPVEAPVDRANLDPLLKALADLQAQKVLSVGPTVPEQYAAGTPLRVLISTYAPEPATQPATEPATQPTTAPRPATTTTELMVNRLNGQCVVWVVGAQPAVVGEVASAFHDILTVEMRDRVVWDVPAAAVEAMTLEQDGLVIPLAKKDGQWVHTEDAFFKVDEGAVHDFLRQINGMKAERFVGAPDDDPARFSLDTPETVLEVRREDGSTDKLTIAPLGPPGMISRYAVSTRAKGYFILPADVAVRFNRELADFAAKAVP